MKILLVDVDGKVPNVALMRISSYYKALGFCCELRELKYGGYPASARRPKPVREIDTAGYEKVFVAYLYNWNREVVTFTDESNVVKGGTGYDINVTLPPEIAECDMDYNLYPDNETSYGFLTRGCLRNCSFCVVPKKEGKMFLDQPIEEIIKHKKVCLMDNNILGHKDHVNLLTRLVELSKPVSEGGRGIKFHFNSGLDIRLITETNLKLLSELNYWGEYLFSYDNPKDRKLINKKIKLLKKYLNKDWKVKFCILVGYHSTLEEDLYRLEWCRKNKVLPYVMRYERCWSSELPQEIRDFYVDLAAYANQPAHFKKLTFNQFLEARHNGKDTRGPRIASSLELWNENIAA